MVSAHTLVVPPRPERLGHGIAAFGDACLLDEIAERGIHFEFCPSSNLALGSVRSIEEHPISVARARGPSALRPTTWIVALTDGRAFHMRIGSDDEECEFR